MYKYSKHYILNLLWLKFVLRIYRSKGKRVLVFSNYLGEIQFFKDVLDAYIERYHSDKIIIAHENEESYFDFVKQYTNSNFDFIHIENNILSQNLFSGKEINLYLSTESSGIANIFSIYLFHGQPSKGLSFYKDKLLMYDSFFLYGPMHKEALHYFAEFFYSSMPKNITCYEIGYPKTDKVINGTIEEFIDGRLDIDPAKKTILYAPAFNEYASLRESGLDILKTIAANNQYNVIAKLPIDCLRPVENRYANGGINWFKEIKLLREQFPNIFLFEGHSIDTLLRKADIMITCVSSVAFEFLVLKKPVIYIDTPKFFSIALTKIYFPNQDVRDWRNMTFINGGKEFGPIVKNIVDLPNVIEKVLNSYANYPYSSEKLPQYLLYNPGSATTVAVDAINSILISNPKSTRERIKTGNILVSQCKIIIQFLKIKLLSFYKKTLQLNRYNSNEKGYIDAISTEREAIKRSMSICDYLESLNIDTRKVGRRDRIVERIATYFVGSKLSVLEIGTGTGMYLEKLKTDDVMQYVVYEVNEGWKKYLKKKFENNIVQILNVNGVDLNQTPNNTINVVHAHAVFVYLPIIQVLNYFIEVARVLVMNGVFIFDIINDTDLTVADAEDWSREGHRFAVVIPHTFIEDFSISYGFEIVTTFKEIYAGSTSTYYVLKKL